MKNKENIKGINLITQKVELDAEGMKTLSFKLRKSEENLILVLASEHESKALLTIMITDDLITDENLNASQMIREISAEINGGGGGQAFFATAGGSKPSGIEKALDKVKQIL